MRTPSQKNVDVLNLTEAATFIRVSQKTLREMARNKKVPCQKAGREWRFLRRGLERWLAGTDTINGVAESQAAYRQATLFQSVANGDEEKVSDFGDTSFTKNRREPLHRWVPWIAGFSAAFVEQVFDSSISGDPRKITVLDPFAGVGTTLVEGLKRGYNVVGFEINPYAALACEVKLRCSRSKLKPLTDVIWTLEDMRRSPSARNANPKSKPPAMFKSKTAFFSPAVEREVLLLQDFIAAQNNAFVKKLLKLALGSVMVACSNYSYEPSLSTRSAAGKDDIEYEDVLKLLCGKLWEIEADIGFLQRHLKRFKYKPTVEIFRHSYLDAFRVSSLANVDVLITSPPYLNNYHYVRNTRPQLYWLDLVEGNGDLKKLEEDSFGRFWQTVRGGPQVQLAFEFPELQELIECVRTRNPEKGVYGGKGWANYATTYFNDCDRFFRVTRRVMKPGGRVVVVIGNNIVQGVHLETDRFLAEISKRHGFSVEGMHRVRRKRTGSSIINSSVRAGTMNHRIDLYETAVELRAPDK